MKHIDLGDIVRELHDIYIDAPYTYAELEDMTGVNAGALRHWLRGRRPIHSVPVLQRLIDAVPAVERR